MTEGWGRLILRFDSEDLSVCDVSTGVAESGSPDSVNLF